MAAVLILGSLGLICWLAADRPSPTRRFGGQRVYLRRGHGLGGPPVIVVAVVAGSIAVSPLALLGGIPAGTTGLDQIVIEAIPAVSEVPGQPAAWYVLATWTWQTTGDDGRG